MSAVIEPADRPEAPAPAFAAIPVELVQLDQWVLWRYELRKDKWTKVPKRTNGLNASSTDSGSWATLANVQRAYMTRPGEFDGVGFVTSIGDTTVLCDLDHVLDPVSGEVVPWAQRILEAAEREGAYIEQSPSGTGFHVIGHGDQGFDGQKRNDAELYCQDRFFTITGLGVTRDPRAQLGTLTDTLELVRERIDSPKDGQKDEQTASLLGFPPAISDDSLLDQARRAKNAPGPATAQ